MPVLQMESDRLLSRSHSSRTEEAVGNFSYSSVVGMLFYLSGHSRPGIAFAVNSFDRYMFCPKKSRELG
ncbi:LOW QUALITY PROTEIN: hypothetical protein ACHAWF_000428 [Thalassiosira exigua]